MNDNAMFADHWEDISMKRIEFRKMMKEIIIQAYSDGNGASACTYTEIEKYAEEKIKDLF
ncbi:MAG: hypothetical protein HC945_03800 [Nitrosarchaeum sp.]|nr:hypothetical protein [Nitrosarchaeum sp.]